MYVFWNPRNPVLVWSECHGPVYCYLYTNRASLCVCVCLCRCACGVCMYVCVCVGGVVCCIHVCMHVCYMGMYVYRCIWMYMCVCGVYVCCVYVCICVCVVCVYVCVCGVYMDMHVWVCGCVWVYVCMYRFVWCVCVLCVCVVCVCVCVYECVWGWPSLWQSECHQSPLSLLSCSVSSCHPVCVSGILIFSVPSALAAVDQKPEAELLHIDQLPCLCACSLQVVGADLLVLEGGLQPWSTSAMGTSGTASFWSSFMFIWGLSSLVLMLTSNWK